MGIQQAQVKKNLSAPMQTTSTFAEGKIISRDLAVEEAVKVLATGQDLAVAR